MENGNALNELVADRGDERGANTATDTVHRHATHLLRAIHESFLGVDMESVLVACAWSYENSRIDELDHALGSLLNERGMRVAYVEGELTNLMGLLRQNLCLEDLAQTLEVLQTGEIRRRFVLPESLPLFV